MPDAVRAPESTPSECDLDERVDVWSLGCLLFAGANGERSPFESALEQAGGASRWPCSAGNAGGGGGDAAAAAKL